jgi:hypothetical protein
MTLDVSFGQRSTVWRKAQVLVLQLYFFGNCEIAIDYGDHLLHVSVGHDVKLV